MQLTRSKSNIVEKVCRDANGRLVRATFCVYESNGHIKARLVKVAYLEEKLQINGRNLSLAGFQTQKTFNTKTTFGGKKIFSFVSFDIYSFGSKPRAPTQQ